MIASQMMIICICFLTVWIYTSIIFVPEGHVGVIKKFGKIQPDLIHGVGLNLLLITGLESITFIKYVIDYDEIHHGEYTSKEGIDFKIGIIRAANEINTANIINTTKRFGLKYDTPLVIFPIPQKLREICRNKTMREIETTDYEDIKNILVKYLQEYNDKLETGIKISWITIEKFTIPTGIKKQQENLAEEKALQVVQIERNIGEMRNEEHKARIANETHIRETNQLNHAITLKMKEKEFERMNATINNNINMDKSLNDLNISVVINKIAIAKTDTQHYENLKNTEITKINMEINGYGELEYAKTLAKNTMFYYGADLPKIIKIDNDASIGLGNAAALASGAGVAMATAA